MALLAVSLGAERKPSREEMALRALARRLTRTTHCLGFVASSALTSALGRKIPAEARSATNSLGFTILSSFSARGSCKPARNFTFLRIVSFASLVRVTCTIVGRYTNMRWVVLVAAVIALRLRQTPVQASLDQGQSREERRYSELALLLFDLLDRDRDHEVHTGDGEALVRRLDGDGDGRISVQEFRRGLSTLLTEDSRTGGLKDRVDTLLAL